MQIPFGSFTSPTTESFEATAGLVISSALGAGFLIPNATSHRFSSGVSLTNLTSGASQRVIQSVIGNFSRGDAGWGLDSNSYIEAALTGNGYLGSNNDWRGLEITLDNDALRIGGWFAAAPGGITMDAYDRNGNLVESATFGSGTAATWRENFFGLEQTNGIKRIRITGSYVCLDDFVFEGGSTPPPPPPAASISGAGRLEGGSGSSALDFTVTLDRASTQTVILNYATSNGSAIAGSDYTAVGGFLSFAPGETSKAIGISVLGDGIVEPDEFFSVNLSNPTGATIASATAIGTILNDDVAAPLPSFSVIALNPQQYEGNSGPTPYYFSVNLSAASAHAISVNYTSLNSSATASDGDFNGTSGVITFAPGETSKSITVNVNGDRRIEGDEAFAVGIFNAVGASIGTTSATATILNDDQREVKADFTSDRRSDLVWRNLNTGQDLIWGSAQAGQTASLPTVGGSWHISTTGDFNPDGKADLVWRDYATGQAVIWLMNGTAVTQGVVLTTIGLEWQAEGSGDFNADGQSDLVWRNYNTGENAIWLMNGTSLSQVVSLSSVPTEWKIDGVGDFTGDNQPDLVWRNYTTGDVYLWQMNGTSYSSSILLTTLNDANWHISAVGDYNGDGQNDLVWRNFTSGDTSLWRMNGTGIQGIDSLGVIGLEWELT